VGVTGGSASGKTSFLAKLAVCLIKQRSVSYPRIIITGQWKHSHLDEKGNINYDLPECFDLDAFHDDMLLLKEGKRREAAGIQVSA
jgi:uridine kinase